MAIKKICQLLLFFCLSSLSYAQENSLGQTIQINTQFRSIVGKPTWLLIIRDMESGQILPFIFDIRSQNNFWVAFTLERSYRITVSSMKFGPYAIIHNFCGLQNGILSGKSMLIRLKGNLTPDPNSSQCYILKYQDMPFTIAN